MDKRMVRKGLVVGIIGLLMICSMPIIISEPYVDINNNQPVDTTRELITYISANYEYWEVDDLGLYIGPISLSGSLWGIEINAITLNLFSNPRYKETVDVVTAGFFIGTIHQFAADGFSIFGFAFGNIKWSKY